MSLYTFQMPLCRNVSVSDIYREEDINHFLLPPVAYCSSEQEQEHVASAPLDHVLQPLNHYLLNQCRKNLRMFRHLFDQLLNPFNEIMKEVVTTQQGYAHGCEIRRV
jgi:hypothetical protein